MLAFEPNIFTLICLNYYFLSIKFQFNIDYIEEQDKQGGIFLAMETLLSHMRINHSIVSCKQGKIILIWFSHVPAASKFKKNLIELTLGERVNNSAKKKEKQAGIFVELLSDKWFFIIQIPS